MFLIDYVKILQPVAICAIIFVTCAIASHSPDVNCAPWSEVMSKGVPKRDTQAPIKALATSVVVVVCKGTASGQRVVRSTIVNKCVKPRE